MIANNRRFLSLLFFTAAAFWLGPNNGHAEELDPPPFVSARPAAESAPDASSFSSVMENDELGLQLEEAPARDQILDWAAEYAEARRLGGKAFFDECQDQARPNKNPFCSLADAAGDARPSLAPPTPGPIRQRFFEALIKIDDPAERGKNCALVSSSLKQIESDESARRLRARALYWLWVCAKSVHAEAEAAAYLDQLWSRFPFDHHTNLALTAAGDQRALLATQDARDMNVSFRSRRETSLNPILAGIEALYFLKKYASAEYVAQHYNDRFKSLEPEVRLYLATLTARISRAERSLLPVTRVLVPLIRDIPSLLNAKTLQVLFPVDYVMIDSERGQDLPVSDLITYYRQDVPPALLAGLVHYESGFNPRANSHKDAYGLLQMLIPTASDERRAETGEKAARVTREQLFDPAFNLKLGARHLSHLQNKFNGSMPLALAAYNAGETGVRQWLGAVPAMKDSQVQADLIFMNSKSEIHVSDYISSVLGKADWYALLYFR